MVIYHRNRNPNLDRDQCLQSGGWGPAIISELSLVCEDHTGNNRGLGDFRICLSLGAGVKHLQCSPQPDTKHTIVPGFSGSRQCVFTLQLLPLLAKSSPKLHHIWSFSSQSSFLLLLYLPGFQVCIHDCSHSTSSFSFIVILPNSHLVCICIQEGLS